ncbi:MAG: hypothetical protein E6R04_00595 [Spirochaetes bacterium]|nr:MAG: hypothetical protein E6R04_00595 [Spirochaetota bacterium]
MPTSYEIASMFAQQNQMFLGQAQFSQSIGVPVPPSMTTTPGGLGGYGMGGPPRGGGGGFNYGASGMMGYGAGNAIAGGIMSAGGAAMHAGLGIGGGLGMMALAGSGFGLPIAAGAMLGQASIGAVMGGAHQQASMNTMLGSQYNFANPAARTGTGFSRDDAKSIGDMTRSLSHIPELMTSFEELQGVMSRMKSSGVMQGVKNASEFQSRFREALSTIKDMSKVLGTTMEEAEQFFSASRSSGFYNRGAQLKNAVSAQFTSSVTGASVGQVAGLQQAGADMAMSFGARRGLGATAVTNIAQSIGLAQMSGRLREGAVEDVTGLQGADAQMALAQKMFGGMMRFGQTSAGRLAMAGMMKYDESGRAIGVDESLSKRFNAGELSIDELKAKASQLTDAQKKSFTARQSDLVASLAGQIGPGGAFTMMKGALGLRGDNDGTNLVMQRLTDMSAGEIDIAEGMQGNLAGTEAGSFARMRQRQASQRERTDPSAIMQKIKTRLHGATVGKLEQAGADIQNSIAKSVDSFFDDLVGREISTLTEERASAISKAFSGANSAQAKELIAGLTKTSSGASSTTGDRLMRVGKSTLFGGAGLLSGARSFVREFGGSDSALSRFTAGLTGGMTEGQEAEFATRLYGTDSASGQAAMAAKLRAGNVAGKGAEATLASVLAGSDMTGKSAAQKVDIISRGMEKKVQSAAEKSGFRDPTRIKNISRETLEGQMSANNLSESEKDLLRSYQDASNDPTGKNVFAQMAAASGAGNLIGSVVGFKSSVDIQRALKTSEADLSATIGEGASSFVKSSSKNSKAFGEAIKDSNITVALGIARETGDYTEARKLINSKLKPGEKLSESEVKSLAEATKGFDPKDDKKVAATQKAIENYTSNANAAAADEFFKNVTSQGQTLVDNAAEGPRGDAQREFGKAMADYRSELMAAGTDEKKRDEVIAKFSGAFSKYSKSFRGLSKKDRESAIEAGGDVAIAAAAEDERRKKLSSKTFSSAEEVAKEFGVSTNDVFTTDFKAGGKLSESAIEKLSKRTGASRALSSSQAGTSGTKAKSKDDTLIETLTKQNELLSKLSTKLDTEKKGWFEWGGSKENSNAGADSSTKLPGDNKKG